MYDILLFSKELTIIEYRLLEWGRWEHYRIGVQRPSSPAAAVLSCGIGQWHTEPDISDTEAEIIQAAIVVLKECSADQGRVVELAFFTGERLRLDALSAKAGFSRSKTAELLNKGLCWLQGYFRALAVSRAA